MSVVGQQKVCGEHAVCSADVRHMPWRAQPVAPINVMLQAKLKARGYVRAAEHTRPRQPTSPNWAFDYGAAASGDWIVSLTPATKRSAVATAAAAKAGERGWEPSVM